MLDLGGFCHPATKILSFFPNDEEKNNYASVYYVQQSALEKEKGLKKEC